MLRVTGRTQFILWVGTVFGVVFWGVFVLCLLQLIDDKKSLSEKCEQLVQELKMIDKKYQDKIKTLEDKLASTVNCL